jgi:deoxyribodipyrimidine photo-lyase
MTIDGLARDPRVTVRRRGIPDPDGEAVVYWMQRAQRASDNPALNVAIEVANLLNKPVVAFLGVNPFVAGANLRHYRFLAEGLADIGAGLEARRVEFVLRAYPDHRLQPLLEQIRPSIVIGDENPLRQTEAWRERVAEQTRVPLWTVDADVVVPSRLIEGEQYAARTIRPRIHKHLPRFTEAEAEPNANVELGRVWRVGRVGLVGPLGRVGIQDLLGRLPLDTSVSPAPGLRGGSTAARAALRHFVAHTLDNYAHARNHPEDEGTSRLSPYLHFGQIGPREVARAITQAESSPESKAAFLEQLIVRRELAVNFVRHNDAYDRLEGCEAWARRTLRQHRFDKRPHLYAADEFEAASTHDPLWNAAQLQMVTTGWMHGYVRMYWAKKILEWSASPEEAFEIAVRLNDRYELDGRDPNGYANIAWAIGGKHDRPWPGRPVYGTIRSMSYASTSRKFDSARYIARYNPTAITPLFHESR